MEDVVLDQTSVHAPTDLPVTAASKVKADRIFVEYSHIDTKPNPASLADVSLLMKICAQRKVPQRMVGRRKRGPLRFVTSNS